MNQAWCDPISGIGQICLDVEESSKAVSLHSPPIRLMIGKTFQSFIIPLGLIYQEKIIIITHPQA